MHGRGGAEGERACRAGEIAGYPATRTLDTDIWCSQTTLTDITFVFGRFFDYVLRRMILGGRPPAVGPGRCAPQLTRRSEDFPAAHVTVR